MPARSSASAFAVSPEEGRWTTLRRSARPRLSTVAVSRRQDAALHQGAAQADRGGLVEDRQRSLLRRPPRPGRADASSSAPSCRRPGAVWMTSNTALCGRAGCRSPGRGPRRTDRRSRIPAPRRGPWPRMRRRQPRRRAAARQLLMPGRRLVPKPCAEAGESARGFAALSSPRAEIARIAAPVGVTRSPGMPSSIVVKPSISRPVAGAGTGSRPCALRTRQGADRPSRRTDGLYEQAACGKDMGDRIPGADLSGSSHGRAKGESASTRPAPRRKSARVTPRPPRRAAGGAGPRAARPRTPRPRAGRGRRRGGRRRSAARPAGRRA